MATTLPVHLVALARLFNRTLQHQCHLILPVRLFSSIARVKENNEADIDDVFVSARARFDTTLCLPSALRLHVTSDRPLRA